MVKHIAKKSRLQNDFYDFLCEYLEINGQIDRIADIAAEAQRDRIFPRGNEKTLDDFKSHLINNYHPIPNALKSLEMAFEIYLKQQVI